MNIIKNPPAASFTNVGRTSEELNTIPPATQALSNRIKGLKNVLVNGVSPVEAALDAAKAIMAGEAVKIFAGREMLEAPGIKQSVQSRCAVKPVELFVSSLKEFEEFVEWWPKYFDQSVRARLAADYNDTYRSPHMGP
jgi:hypothetical protein